MPRQYNPALQKQTIAVQFTGGLDNKTASQLSLPGSFLKLENAVRRKNKLVTKRFGFSSLGNGIIGSSSLITDGKRIDTFKDDLLLLNTSNIYSYASSNDAWIDRGQLISTLVAQTAIIRNTEIQAMADIDHVGGLTCSAWEDSRGGIRCALYDDSTGSAILSDEVVSSTGSRPKVVALELFFLITYIDGLDFKVRRIERGNPTTLLTEQTVVGGTIADFPYDVTKFRNNAAVFGFNTSTNITIGYIADTGVLGAPATNGLPGSDTIAERGRNCLSVVADETNSRVYYLYHDDSTGEVRVTACSASFITKISTTVDTILFIRNITGTLTNTYDLLTYYEQSSASPKDHLVRTNTVTFDDVSVSVGTPAYFKRSVGLISKAYTIGSKSYVTLTHQSSLQPTYFTVENTGFIVTRMLSGLGGGLSKSTSGSLKSGLSRVALTTSNSYIAALQVRIRVRADNDGTVLADAIGITKAEVTFGSSQLIGETLGLNYHIAGGILLAYDGVSAVEHGFHIFPEDLDVTAQSGGSLSTGNYEVQAIYEWVDGQGQIHRSIPSTAVITAITSGQRLQVIVPTLRLTQKTGTRTNVKIVVFRTLVDGTAVFYRDNEATNDPTVDSVTISLTQSDTSLAGHEILYTVGGILDNAPAPAAMVAHKHLNRMWLAGLEDSNSIAYSKEQVFGEGIAFVDEFRTPVDPLGGGVLSLSSLDDKLIIFKSDRAFFISGEGPVDTGAQNDYTKPQLISSDVGCRYPKSICIMPDGVMFKSDKGIYLLNRSLQMKYVGAPVEDFNDLTVSSAVLIEDSNEVRFTTEDGSCLVYNYFFDQWSVFTNYEAVSATNALSSYLHLKADGIVNKEDQGSYLDNGQKIKRAMETTWFSFLGVQAYQRIYRYAVLGDFLSNHITKIKVAYNFESVYNETVYFNTETGLMTTVYGTDTYGTESPYGGSGSTVYQFRSKPVRQKCESIKLRIEDLDDIVAEGGGCFDLSGITFEVGIKEGIHRMGSSKSIGSL